MKIFDEYKNDCIERYKNINYISDSFHNNLYRMLIFGICIQLSDSILITLKYNMRKLQVLDDASKYTKVMEFLILRLSNE